MPDDLTATPYETDRPETPADREERIRWEAEVIARGRAEIAAGLGIDGDAFDAWLERLEQDEDAPFPKPVAAHPLPPRS